MTAQEAFDCYYQQVFGFVCRLTRSREAAEDIAQECFLTLVRAPQKFDEGRGSMRTYLFAIARNPVLKRYRDYRREEQLDLGMRIA
jgi:RNA polymerase sigma-70 factor (ECF subfamily)